MSAYSQTVYANSRSSTCPGRLLLALAKALQIKRITHDESCLSPLKLTCECLERAQERLSFYQPYDRESALCLYCVMLFVLFRVISSSQTVSQTLAPQARIEAARSLRGKIQCCHVWKKTQRRLSIIIFVYPQLSYSFILLMEKSQSKQSKEKGVFLL